jgi:TatA/E family protein of Tat protein translocase
MNLGMPEMIFIFLLALVLFGPKKLPELGRQLGKALAEFKKASNEFKSQLEMEMMNIELEERSRRQPEPPPKILPAEKLFDPVSVPPIDAIPRESLPAASEPPVADIAARVEENTASVAEQPLTPNVPSQNA